MSNKLFQSDDGNHPGADEHLDMGMGYGQVEKRNQASALPLRIEPVSEAFRPVCKTEGSIGYDCFANLRKPTVINPGRRIKVPLGFFIEARKGYGLWVVPKSGLASNHLVTVLNSPGLVDSDYPGEVAALLINHGEYKFHLNPKDAVCQIVPTDAGLLQIEGTLTQAQSRRGGFGSTAEV